MRTNMQVSIEITYGEGVTKERLRLDNIVTSFDLEELRPPRESVPTSLTDYAALMQQQERRTRFVDALSGNIALAITEELYNKVR